MYCILKKRVIPIFLCFTLLFLFACKKKPIDKENAIDQVDIESIKTSYYKDDSYKLMSTPLNDSLFIIWRLQWDHILIGQENDKKAYYIPFSPEVVGGMRRVSKNIQVNEKRYLVAYKKNEKFQFYYASSVDQGNEIDKPLPFTGRLLFSKPGVSGGVYNEFNNGVRYKNPTGAHTESCLYYSICTWVGYCDGVQTVVYTRGQGTPTKTLTCGIPSISACPNTNWYSGWSSWDVFCTGDIIDPLPPPTLPNNNGGGSGGSGGGTLGSGGGGIYKLDTILIDPILVYPCFQWSVNAIFTNNMNNIITSIFNQLFGGTGDFTVVFTQGQYGNAFAAKAHPENNYYINIVFNTDQLAQSSRELIVASALHEMIHGIFLAKKVASGDPLEWGEAFQHQIMATSYVGNMADALQSILPNLTYADAEALAWGGLQGTNAWLNYKQTHAVEANNILLRADQFDKNHTKGTRCP
ncbi:hypothetical protein ACTJJ0_26185 [Chitinophaga sp. 22321]|uniref:Uncharacterized protein n=1 Tax=Chitinophaga hostae TaxID=2831022 RepID=A0ABS5J6A0_9BACT|nr:hypothetical protein [Chitinophaga hostae]MBS0030591.1 hypothetical protein [Chitinophaga hostae]